MSLLTSSPERTVGASITAMSRRICSICHQHFTEWGADAQPVAKGRCCEKCNARVVIPARVKAKRAKQLEGSKRPAHIVGDLCWSLPARKERGVIPILNSPCVLRTSRPLRIWQREIKSGMAANPRCAGISVIGSHRRLRRRASLLETGARGARGARKQGSRGARAKSAVSQATGGAAAGCEQHNSVVRLGRSADRGHADGPAF